MPASEGESIVSSATGRVSGEGSISISGESSSFTAMGSRPTSAGGRCAGMPSTAGSRGTVSASRCRSMTSTVAFTATAMVCSLSANASDSAGAGRAAAVHPSVPLELCSHGSAEALLELVSTGDGSFALPSTSSFVKVGTAALLGGETSNAACAS